MSGFVYMWFDCKKKRYYLGSHWGAVDDGYVCSSKWMKAAYRRRPSTFRRRIIGFKNTLVELREEELRLLRMIKDEELGTRYYNLKRNAGPPGRSTKGQKRPKEWGDKISKANKGRKLSEAHKAKLKEKRNKRIAALSDESKDTISVKLKQAYAVGRKVSTISVAIEARKKSVEVDGVIYESITAYLKASGTSKSEYYRSKKR